MRTFSGSSADSVWQQLAALVRDGSEFRPCASRSGATIELLHAGITIEDPSQRWVTSRQPAMNIAFALAEVVWIILGRDDSSFVNYWNRQLPKYAGDGPRYHGAYGHRIRRQQGIDQLERAYLALGSKPDSRQVLLQIWDSAKDLPREDGIPVDKDIPCNIASLPKVRDGKLEWLQIIRSNDLYLGIPHNFVQFTYLQEILAGWLGVGIGTYNQISDSLHMYEKDRAFVTGSISIPVEANTDSIGLPRDQSEQLFIELGGRIDQFVTQQLSKAGHIALSQWRDAPEGFQNILRVIAAEGARRRGWPHVASEIMAECTNHCFAQLWKRWMNRLSTNSGRRSDEGCR